MNITEKITEIIKAAEKNSWINYDLQKDHSLSLAAPESENVYLEKRLFALRQQIATDTVIGQSWAENYFNDNIIENGWIQKHTDILLKHIDEKAALEDLRLFMKQYFNLLSYEKFINEGKLDVKPFPSAWAYCFSILSEMDSPQAIEHCKGTKKEVIKKLALNNHFDPKSFEIAYNSLRDASQAEKTTSRRIPTIRKAIELFNENPEFSNDKTEGLIRANKYLKIATYNA